MKRLLFPRPAGPGRSGGQSRACERQSCFWLLIIVFLADVLSVETTDGGIQVQTEQASKVPTR